MPPLAALDAISDQSLHSFQRRLTALFDDIDAAYDAVAAAYGFACNGCAENCCLTRFHHHTLIEFALLRSGFSRLPDAMRQAAADRSKAVIARHREADVRGVSPRVMCPLNVDQRCLVYRCRPMICRMHGIPHVLHPPGRPAVAGPGCRDFSDRHPEASGPRYDRTPFYRALADLEKEVRSAAGFGGKVKLTVAEMIEAIEKQPPSKEDP